MRRACTLSTHHVCARPLSRVRPSAAAGPIADVFDEAMDIQSDMVHRAQEEKRDAEVGALSAEANVFGGGSHEAPGRRMSMSRQRTSGLFPVQLNEKKDGSSDAVMRALKRGIMTSKAEAEARGGAGKWAFLGGSLKKVRSCGQRRGHSSSFSKLICADILVCASARRRLSSCKQRTTSSSTCRRRWRKTTTT